MEKDIAYVLLSKEQIASKVKELGEQISKDYKDKNLLILGLLKGSVVFAADLMRAVEIPVTLDFMAISSYGNEAKTTGEVRVIKDISIDDITPYDVLVVEDILDSGNTLFCIRELIKKKNPKSVEIAALLNKPSRREKEVKVSYQGYEIPDEFVVGYGLDYAEKYRNLPYIGVLKPEVYSK